MSKMRPIRNEQRFRTPAASERELGLWVDRIGRREAETIPPAYYRKLRQYGVVVIESGEGRVETADQRSWTVSKGDVIFLPPDWATRYYPSGAWDTRWIVWGGAEAAILARHTGLADAAPVVRQAAAGVQRAWTRLNDLMARPDFNAALERKLVLLEMIHHLACALPGDAEAGKDACFVRIALQELGGGESPMDSVPDVARRLHMSEVHFRRRFKACTGVTPKAYHTSLRINRAKALLADGVSLKEVAQVLGFSDVFYFMRIFGRVTRQTAKQFASGHHAVAPSAHGRRRQPGRGD